MKKLIALIVIGILNQIQFNYDALVFYISNFFNLGVNWYFWMVIGVFLAIPVINEFIKNKKIEGAKYFTSIFIISSIVNGSKYNLSLVVKSVETVSGLLFIIMASYPAFLIVVTACTVE